MGKRRNTLGWITARFLQSTVDQIGYTTPMKSTIQGIWSRVAARMPRLVKRKRFYVPALIVLVGAGAWAALGQGSAVPAFETGIVERGPVERTISETGTVAPADEVSLAFTGSGRVVAVEVAKGDQVRAGQVLASLDSVQARASLAKAQAALRAAEARAGSAGSTRTQVAQQQEQMVASARTALISGDLQAYLVSGGREADFSYAQPTITGTYRCAAQGEYRVRLYGSSSLTGYSFTLSGIESGNGSVSTSQPQPLGSCGLFIQFPENFARGSDIVWSIPIPNTRSATYVTRKSAYEAALQARDLALLDGMNAPVLAADIDQARAGVRAAEAALAETNLVAPFAGLVTDLAVTRGQIASPGTPALSLISASRFEIAVEIPEDDIVGIEVGDRAAVTFDAFRNTALDAHVVYVAPAARARASGGVAFEVLLQFSEEDERVRAGLTADVEIFAEKREDVLRVPVRAVIEEDGMRYVRVLVDDATWRRTPVTTGLRGGGFYEVTGGLEGGERIITFANGAALNALTELPAS